ncbi:hypothetical protein L7F22_003489 [Adiantum nelumboides]|nr:hypothetical protein [Adiantum nelumboides]MCO5550012.1 hypothetical protein [Adiantum nelumboides]
MAVCQPAHPPLSMSSRASPAHLHTPPVVAPWMSMHLMASFVHLTGPRLAKDACGRVLDSRILDGHGTCLELALTSSTSLFRSTHDRRTGRPASLLDCCHSCRRPCISRPPQPPCSPWTSPLRVVDVVTPSTPVHGPFALVVGRGDPSVDVHAATRLAPPCRRPRHPVVIDARSVCPCRRPGDPSVDVRAASRLASNAPSSTWTNPLSASHPSIAPA